MVPIKDSDADNIALIFMLIPLCQLNEESAKLEFYSLTLFIMTKFWFESSISIAAQQLNFTVISEELNDFSNV